jgi:hypothetical protein
MLSRIMVILCLVGSLVLVWVGCSGDPTCVKGAANVEGHRLTQVGEACGHDVDCQSGFCDRGQCKDVDMYHGNRCAPPAPDAGAVEKLPEFLCHGYLCLEGRCRSCQSDAECQSYYGVGKCTVVPDAPGWPRRAVCYPATTRRPLGFECTEDEQCRSLFCDRGTCTNIMYRAIQNYGEACTPDPPKALPDDLRVAPTVGKCEGYLCVDRRCRSCQSDAECQEVSSDLVCQHFPHRPGQVCITRREAELHPPPVVISIDPSPDLDHGGPHILRRGFPGPIPSPRCR